MKLTPPCSLPIGSLLFVKFIEVATADPMFEAPPMKVRQNNVYPVIIMYIIINVYLISETFIWFKFLSKTAHKSIKKLHV